MCECVQPDCHAPVTGGSGGGGLGGAAGRRRNVANVRGAGIAQRRYAATLPGVSRSVKADVRTRGVSKLPRREWGWWARRRRPCWVFFGSTGETKRREVAAGVNSAAATRAGERADRHGGHCTGRRTGWVSRHSGGQWRGRARRLRWWRVWRVCRHACAWEMKR